VAAGRRRLHNKELHNLYTSLTVFGVIKSRRMKRMVHVTRFRQMRIAYKILVGKTEGKNFMENRSVDGIIILEWIIRKYKV
jgi:protein tyrosine phosphatase